MQKAFQIHRVIKYKHVLPGEYCCLQEDFSILSHKNSKCRRIMEGKSIYFRSFNPNSFNWPSVTGEGESIMISLPALFLGNAM